MPDLAINVLPPLFSQRGHGDRLHAALLHPLNHHRENTLCFAAAFQNKKNIGPSPLKTKQLQTLNIYWETCASHQTKTQSLYPAGLQGVIDRKLFNTYMSFWCTVNVCMCVYTCVCLWHVYMCLMSSCLCCPVCLSVCSVNRHVCAHVEAHI